MGMDIMICVRVAPSLPCSNQTDWTPYCASVSVETPNSAHSSTRDRETGRQGDRMGISWGRLTVRARMAVVLIKDPPARNWRADLRKAHRASPCLHFSLTGMLLPRLECRYNNTVHTLLMSASLSRSSMRNHGRQALPQFIVIFHVILESFPSASPAVPH